jgi:4-amino-4-deoxy-L-arabinose transferase-like glycosyltransferase
MAMAGIIFWLVIVFLIFVIILWILSFFFFKRNKKILSIIFLVVGLIVFIPWIYIISQIFNPLPKDNLVLEYDYSKEFTQLSNGFIEIVNFNKETTARIDLEITGFVNGRGKLLIVDQQYKENEEKIWDIEDEVDIVMINVKWHSSEGLIKFIPENEFVDGNILIIIRIYKNR